MEYPQELKELEEEWIGRRLPRLIIWNEATRVAEEKHKKEKEEE